MSFQEEGYKVASQFGAVDTTDLQPCLGTLHSLFIQSEAGAHAVCCNAREQMFYFAAME